MTEPTFANLKSIVEGLEEKYEKQTKDLEDSVKARTDLQKENDELKKELDKLQSDKADLEKQILGLFEEKMEAYERQIKSLKEQGESALEKFKSEKTQLENILKRYEEQNKVKEDQALLKVAALQQSLVEKKALLTSMKDENNSRILYLWDKVKSYQNRTHNTSQFYKNIQNTAKRLEETVDKLKKEEDSMKEVIRVLEEQKEQLIGEARNESLSQTEVINQLVIQGVEKDSKIQSLEFSLQQADHDFDRLFTQFQDATRQLQDLDTQLTETIKGFFDRYYLLKDFLRRNFRIKNDGTLDERYSFTKEFICLSQIIKVNPVQSLFSVA